MPARAGLDVSHFDLGAHSELLERAERELGLLSPDEIGGREDERPLTGERRLARIALRLTLATAGEAGAVGHPLARSARGKPFVPGSDVGFSLSHSAGRVLVAIAVGGSVGVDIEKRRTLRMTELRVHQIEGAASALCADFSDGGGPAGQSIAAWCVLEAYAKACCDGIGALFGELGIMGPGGRSRAAIDISHAAAQHQARSGLGVAMIGAGPEMAAALCAPMDSMAALVADRPVASPLSAATIESMISLAGRLRASSG